MHCIAQRFGKWRFVLWCVALLPVLWTLLALVLPSVWLKDELEERLSASLHAPARVQGVRINPLTLQVNVTGVHIANPGGEGDLLVLDDLTLRPALAWANGAAAIRLSLRVKNPVLNIAYLGRGRFSFSDLGRKQAAQEGGDSFQWPSFFIPDRLELLNGTILLRDEPSNLVHTIEEIGFSTSFLPVESASAQTPPLFSGVYNGTRFEVTGRQLAQGTGQRTEFTLHTAPLGLEHFRRYLELYTPLQLEKGSVQLDLSLGLSRNADGVVEADFFGGAVVEDTQIRAPGGEIAGRLHKGEFRLRRFTLSERRVNLSRVELSGLYLRIERGKDGRTDWEKWLGAMLSASVAESPDAVSAVPTGRILAQASSQGTGEAFIPPPLIVEGADLILRDSDFTWTDAAWADTGKVEITGVDGRIAEYSTRTEARTTLRLSFGVSREGVLALEGTGYFEPPSLDADLTIDDLPLLLTRPFLGNTPLHDAAGRVDFKGHLQVNGDQVSLEQSSVALRALSFGRGKNAQASVDVQSVNVADLAFNLREKSASAKRVDLKSPSVLLRSLTSANPVATPHATLPWTVEVEKLTVSDGRVESAFAATNARERRNVLLTNWDAEAGPVSGDARKVMRFMTRARGEKGGMLQMHGSVRPEPLDVQADLKIDDVRLESLAVVLRQVTNLSVSGRAQADLSVSLQRGDGGSPWAGVLSGTTTLRDVSLAEAVSGRRVGGFRRFTLETVRYDWAAGIFSVGDVLLDLPQISLRLEKDGSFNLERALRPSIPGSSAQATVVATTTSVSASSSVPRPLFSVFSAFSVGSIRVQNGRIVFRDERLSPSFALTVTDINARGTEFSSSPSSRSSLSLSAQVDGTPLGVTGQINPALFPAQADLNITVMGLDLRPYSPYGVRHMGYPVEQGRLDLNTHLLVSGWNFRADNRLRLEKLGLGPKDTSPGAPDYPVTLGISLLQGLNGDIGLDVPVWGRLDQGNISVGSLGGDVVLGLLSKILASPFALVGGLISLGSDNGYGLQMTAFLPGREVLSRPAREQAAAIARLLEEKPRLTVQLIGMYDAQSDAQALSMSRVQQRVLALTRTSLVPAEQKSASRKRSRGHPQDYEKRLSDLYSQEMGKKQNGPVLRQEPDVMERWLAEQETVDAADLKLLAGQRAEAVKAEILKANPTLSARVTLAMDAFGRPDVVAGASRVEARLR